MRNDKSDKHRRQDGSAQERSDSITILTCLDKHAIATKKWKLRADDKLECTDYKSGKWFSVDVKRVSSIGNLADRLQNIEADPGTFVIRGEPLPDTNLERTRRLSKPKKDHTAAFGEPEGGRRYVMLDFDNVRCPKKIDFTQNPESGIRHLISLLPSSFHDVTCFYQVSASAGVKPGLRAHLWFWLDRRVTNAELKTWAKDLSVAVDRTLFGPVQPHYVATPQFKGIADPFRGQRSGLVQGRDDEVVFPPVKVTPHRNSRVQWREWADKRLAGYENQIKRAMPGERHRVVNYAAYQMGRLVPHLIDRQTVFERLMASVAKMEEPLPIERAKDEIGRAMNDGIEKPDNPEDDWRRGLALDRSMRPKAVVGNVVMVLKAHPAWSGVLAYDSRKLRPCFVKSPPWETSAISLPRHIREEDAGMCAAWFTRELAMGISISVAHDAMGTVATDKKFDPVRQYFDGLVWDAGSRLDTWLVDYAGATDSSFVRAVGAKWLISAVARTYKPGCKVDTILILEGAQGKGKSMALRVMAGDDFFTDHLEDLGNKDSRIQLHGPLIVEMAELDAMNRKEASTIKAFLTVQEDRFRSPYGRIVERFPRRCIFAGSTNQALYLKDQTGGRRFWPVAVGKINIDGLRKVRDQLWAEAVYRFQRREDWWLSKKLEHRARGEQEARRQTDPWEEPIYEYLTKTWQDLSADGAIGVVFGGEEIKKRFDPSGLRLWTTTEEVLAAIGLGRAQRDKPSQMRCGECLKVLGWKKRRLRVDKNRQINAYFPPDGFFDK